VRFAGVWRVTSGDKCHLGGVGITAIEKSPGEWPGFTES